MGTWQLSHAAKSIAVSVCIVGAAAKEVGGRLVHHGRVDFWCGGENDRVMRAGMLYGHQKEIDDKTFEFLFQKDSCVSKIFTYAYCT
jgi:hypothetical protein